MIKATPLSAECGMGGDCEMRNGDWGSGIEDLDTPMSFNEGHQECPTVIVIVSPIVHGSTVHGASPFSIVHGSLVIDH
jgi:hypothetical protein